MAACKVGDLLESLPAGDRAVLRDWATRTLPISQAPATAMAQALTADGHQVSPTTLKDHRGRRCVCYRKATA